MPSPRVFLVMLVIPACGGTATAPATTAEAPARAPEDPSAPPAATPGAPEDVTPLMAARSSPASATTAYLDAAIAGEFDEMYALMTPEGRAQEKAAAQGYTRRLADRKIELRSYAPGEPEILADTATVPVTAKFMADGAEDEEALRFELRQREPEGWQIAAIR